MKLTKQEFEMLCACVDVAIKQSQDSRTAAKQLDPILNKLQQVIDHGDSDNPS
ncbi:MAG: hypothetical protein ACYSUC_13190 [Planctomycetota bacterium]|jgi:hypothetical protein